jgi:hypothetical protein
MARPYNLWQPDEEEQLIQMSKVGIPISLISKNLGKSVKQVYKKRYELGVGKRTGANWILDMGNSSK